MITRPTIVFDLDGTLADSVEDLLAAMNHTLESHGLPHYVASDFARLSGQGGMRAMLSLAFAKADRALDEEDLNVVFKRTVRRYDDHIAVHTKLYPGVQTALETFRDADWRMAVCSNKPLRQTTKLLNALDITNFFATISGGDSYAYQKPDPRHVSHTIRDAGCDVSRAVMVGDSAPDIRAAPGAGIPVIAVDFGYSSVPVHTLNPTRVVSRYDTLYADAVDMIGQVDNRLDH